MAGFNNNPVKDKVFKQRQYEYKLYTPDITKTESVIASDLNELGKEGWELVAVASIRHYLKRSSLV